MNKEELSKLEDLQVLMETAGGKYLQSLSKEVLVNTIQELSNSYKEKSHIELIALCAKLSVNLGQYQLLTGITEQIESIKKLFESENQENK